MEIERINGVFQRALTANYATNGYPTLIPTTTPPVPSQANGIFAPGGMPKANTLGMNQDPALVAPQSLIACFFGTGSNGNTFKSMLVGWKQTDGQNNTSLWVPCPLFEVTATLTSSAVGIAGSDVAATSLFAGTLSLTANSPTTDTIGTQLTAPISTMVGHLVTSLHGFGAFQWIFTTGGSATDCNALWALF